MKHAIKKAVTILAVLIFAATCVPFVQAADAGKININMASAEELVALKYVGAKLAQRIVQYREENGPFKAPEDITKVPGVGSKVLQMNKDVITVE